MASSLFSGSLPEESKQKRDDNWRQDERSDGLRVVPELRSFYLLQNRQPANSDADQDNGVDSTHNLQQTTIY